MKRPAIEELTMKRPATVKPRKPKAPRTFKFKHSAYTNVEGAYVFSSLEDGHKELEIDTPFWMTDPKEVKRFAAWLLKAADYIEWKEKNAN